MDKDKEKEKRKNFNEDILKRFKAGDSLQRPSQETWFPLRPIIAKDEKHIKELYGENAKIVGIINVPKLVCIQNNQVEGAKDGQGKDQGEGEGNGKGED
jgi:hypothetical protein